MSRLNPHADFVFLEICSIIFSSGPAGAAHLEVQIMVKSTATPAASTFRAHFIQAAEGTLRDTFKVVSGTPVPSAARVFFDTLRYKVEQVRTLPVDAPEAYYAQALGEVHAAAEELLFQFYGPGYPRS